MTYPFEVLLHCPDLKELEDAKISADPALRKYHNLCEEIYNESKESSPLQ